MKETHYPKLEERIFRQTCDNGLRLFVVPKRGFAKNYAFFATNYGSMDMRFCLNGEWKETPAGVAHYLEHKMFDTKDGNALQELSQLGAEPNAFTSDAITGYYFTATEHFEESLRILLSFVSVPYFTEESVSKEQGIIGQEIRMCEDSPSRRVLFNLLRALYHEHPIKIDIAGTVESIAQITPELLYGCYNTFYNLRNMVLVVAGNVTAEQVLRVADRMLKPAPAWQLERTPADEPADAVTSRVEETMPVSAPLFYLGYKEVIPREEGTRCRTAEELAAAEVLLDLLAGKASPLYARLMDEGLINAQFGADYFEGPGYAVWLFAGESRDPDAVRRAIEAELARARREGFAPADFEAARNALYGRLITALNSVENCGDFLVNDYFYGRKPFALIDAAASLDLQSVYDLLHGSLRAESSALSVVHA